MKAWKIVAALIGTVGWTTPASSQQAVKPADVAIYVSGTNQMSGLEDRALREAVDRILARAGVTVVWVDGKLNLGQPAAAPVLVLIRFLCRSMPNHTPNALAFTAPFSREGKTITVFCDRILPRGRARERDIMTHVIVHEISHVLQGTNGHAHRGIMKASWDDQDWDAMRTESLEFTPGDIDLIHQGLDCAKALARKRADYVSLQR